VDHFLDNRDVWGETWRLGMYYCVVDAESDVDGGRDHLTEKA
jgi:hypothetical protein